MLMTFRGASTEHPCPNHRTRISCAIFYCASLESISSTCALLKISYPPTAVFIRQILNHRRGLDEGKEVELGAHLREPRELRQGLLGPARWVTREVLAVTPMVFPTRREAANNFLL